MTILSVNVGMPRSVRWKNRDVRTGIFKEPVQGAVMVRRLNLDGDGQADLRVHGGPDKAVYGYASEHYEHWRRELAGAVLSYGVFGENLTTEGVNEESLHIGDMVAAGGAVLQVTQPRQPCFKLALRFGDDQMIERFLYSRRSGFYFRVLEQGTVEAGAALRVVERDPLAVSVDDILRLYLGETDDAELRSRALRLIALPDGWKAQLENI